MSRVWSPFVVMFLVLVALSCTHTAKQATQEQATRSPGSQLGSTQSQASLELPTLMNFVIDDRTLKTRRVPEDLKPLINHYFSFLGLDPNSKLGKNTFSRLMYSSTQFLACADFEDWECLEAPPKLLPSMEFRQETSVDLGQKINIDGPFLVKTFFTTKYYRNGMNHLKSAPNPKPGERTMAMELGDIIDRGQTYEPWSSGMLSAGETTKATTDSGQAKWGAISMAVFGIDDLEGTMSPVWTALTRAQEKDTLIRGVFDAIGVNKTEKTPIFVSYLDPVHPRFSNHLFSLLDPEAKKTTTLGRFQYKDTVRVIQALNKGIEKESETKARLEWPMTGEIMHNKFFVFSDEAKAPQAVWTGTANVAMTCMGKEANSNMAVYIQDPNIAQTFFEEFLEMYQGEPGDVSPIRDRFQGVDGAIPHGRFHRAKRPQTKRYFSYSDGTEVRVHFSPTDDGEHRAIIPFLLSARAGDEIRISMFASGGIEVVRAIQYAVAKGAHVKIVFDKLTNSGCGSWINNVYGNIQQENPYAKALVNPKTEMQKGTLEFRVSDWSGGKDHHKIATITRNGPRGLVPEVLIIGSQNWTVPGNDNNDENMLTIRNRRPTGLLAAQDFNNHFDEKLWQVAVEQEFDQKKDKDCRRRANISNIDPSEEDNSDDGSQDPEGSDS